MKTYPKIKIDRYDKLEPGDLFSAELHQIPFLALKCAKNKDGDPSEFVALGPAFPYAAHEAFLMPWDGFTAVSYGKDFSIILPTAAGAWREQAERRKPVCLALCENELYICVNGAKSPQQHFPCFVHIATGKIIENRLPTHALYTHDWQIVVEGPANTTLPILRFPLPEPVKG